MKIAVCVKQVPDGRLRIVPDSMRLDRSGPGDLNNVDRFAVEAAIRLKEAIAGAELVALSMGPKDATETLRTALALGADRAVLVSDDAAAGSDLLATAKVLARALAGQSVDLTLFGQQSADGGGGLLWAAVADLLRLPFISQAADLIVEGDTVRVTRQTEFGDDVVAVSLPAMVAVTDSINEPRYTSLRGVMAAKKKPLEVLSLADLGLDPADAGTAGSRTEVLATGAPPTRADAVRIQDDAEAAEAIVEFLTKKQLV
jgi:electron transfer flavoprotein beta subunit